MMIIATAIPASASYVVINGITYEYSGKEATVKSYVTNIAFPNGKVVIPSQITVADKKSCLAAYTSSNRHKAHVRYAYKER